MGTISLQLLANTGIGSIWKLASWEGKAIIIILMVFSMFAWSVMVYKTVQIRRAVRLNRLFNLEYRGQESVLTIHDRQVQVEGCPKLGVYEAGCHELSSQLERSRKGPYPLTWKGMEHIKRALERAVANESLRLESGLILLAIAVSGSPFLGLLGTVWGVMNVFKDIALSNQANLPTMAPGLSAAMMTTVAGLLVAIPAMFGYNWLVHHLRILTVELDNFAQELASNIETEFLMDEEPLSQDSLKPPHTAFPQDPNTHTTS